MNLQDKIETGLMNSKKGGKHVASLIRRTNHAFFGSQDVDLHLAGLKSFDFARTTLIFSEKELENEYWESRFARRKLTLSLIAYFTLLIFMHPLLIDLFRFCTAQRNGTSPDVHVAKMIQYRIVALITPLMFFIVIVVRSRPRHTFGRIVMYSLGFWTLSYSICMTIIKELYKEENMWTGVLTTIVTVCVAANGRPYFLTSFFTFLLPYLIQGVWKYFYWSSKDWSNRGLRFLAEFLEALIVITELTVRNYFLEKRDRESFVIERKLIVRSGKLSNDNEKYSALLCNVMPKSVQGLLELNIRVDESHSGNISGSTNGSPTKSRKYYDYDHDCDDEEVQVSKHWKIAARERIRSIQENFEDSDDVDASEYDDVEQSLMNVSVSELSREKMSSLMTDVSIMFISISSVHGKRLQTFPESSQLELWNQLFTLFDPVLRNYGFVKLKTVLSTYIMYSTSPSTRAHDAMVLANVLREIARFERYSIRIGYVHHGIVFSGLLGRSKLQYDLIGPAMNVAARLLQTCPSDYVHIDNSAYTSLNSIARYSGCVVDGIHDGAYLNISRPIFMDLKGLGITKTFFISTSTSAIRSTSFSIRTSNAGFEKNVLRRLLFSEENMNVPVESLSSVKPILDDPSSFTKRIRVLANLGNIENQFYSESPSPRGSPRAGGIAGSETANANLGMMMTGSIDGNPDDDSPYSIIGPLSIFKRSRRSKARKFSPDLVSFEDEKLEELYRRDHQNGILWKELYPNEFVYTALFGFFRTIPVTVYSPNGMFHLVALLLFGATRMVFPFSLKAKSKSRFSSRIMRFLSILIGFGVFCGSISSENSCLFAAMCREVVRVLSYSSINLFHGFLVYFGMTSVPLMITVLIHLLSHRILDIFRIAPVIVAGYLFGCFIFLVNVERRHSSAVMRRVKNQKIATNISSGRNRFLLSFFISSKFLDMLPAMKNSGSDFNSIQAISRRSVKHSLTDSSPDSNSFLLRRRVSTEGLHSLDPFRYLECNDLHLSQSDCLIYDRASKTDPSDTSVLIIDIVDHTAMMAGIGDPRGVFRILDEFFSACDSIAGLTSNLPMLLIGDSYVCCSVSEASTMDCLAMGLGVLNLITRDIPPSLRNARSGSVTNGSFRVRIGIGKGELWGGVACSDTAVFEFWGNARYIAQEMERVSKSNSVCLPKSLVDRIIMRGDRTPEAEGVEGRFEAVEKEEIVAADLVDRSSSSLDGDGGLVFDDNVPKVEDCNFQWGLNDLEVNEILCTNFSLEDIDGILRKERGDVWVDQLLRVTNSYSALKQTPS